MGRLVVGTRGSALALWQARHIATALRENHRDLRLEERIITAEGDRETGPVGQAEGRGVFVREIEEALLAGRIDLAVHSLKDLPTTQPEGLVIAAVPERHDPRDALLSMEGWSVDQLPRGAVVGTGSPRRRSQLLHARPDLKVVPVRGNVDTRIRKLREGGLDALVLALAGVERLGITSVPAVAIPVEMCLPAVGQGALAVETRADDASTRDRVRPLDDSASARATSAERAFLRRLGGGCLAPATAYARIAGDRMIVEAVVAHPDGARLMRESERGAPDDGEEIGRALGERMLAAGAGDLLTLAREGDDHVAS